MEMLDGTEVVRVVGASEAGPVAVDEMGIGADAGSGAEAPRWWFDGWCCGR